MRLLFGRVGGEGGRGHTWPVWFCCRLVVQRLPEGVPRNRRMRYSSCCAGTPAALRFVAGGCMLLLAIRSRPFVKVPALDTSPCQRQRQPCWSYIKMPGRGQQHLCL